MKVWVQRGAIAAGIGFMWIGWIGAGVAVAGTPLVALALRRRERRQFQQNAVDALPALIDSIAAAVKAGVAIPRALHDVTAPDPLRDALDAYRSRLGVGEPFEDALSAITDRIGSSQATLLRAALLVGNRSGGDIASMLRIVSRVARDRRMVEREARVLGAQARLSSSVVASLPVLFLFVTSGTSKDQMNVLLHTPIGWGLLFAGASLEALGLIWIRKVAS
ncbi:MAG: type II secretion system F family protein [Actinomycetota bacterium]